MKKLLSVFVAFALMLGSSLSLSSCVMGTGENGNTDSTINVQGGDTHNIQINSSASQTVLAANKALLSSVRIISAFSYNNSGYGGGYGSGSVAGYSNGSGVIFKLNESKSEAYILTNYHVLYNSSYGLSSDITVYLYGREATECAMSAQYVGGSMYYDLAVLKITNSPILMESTAVAATFADSDELAILDTVIAIGNAQGDGIAATVGNLSVDSEYITLMGADDRTEISLRVMRTDAAVNPGNSGGGLFNSKGELVGVVNAKNADDSVDNIGYAIPSNVAKSIVENIIYYCDGTEKTTVYRCLLGITVQAKNPYTEYDTETGIVHKFEDVAIVDINSGTQAADVLKSGDILRAIEIDGVKRDITRRHHVIDSMLDARAGSVIKITVERDGEEKTVTITATEGMLEAYK